MTIYRPGQASILFDVWPEEAELFIVGGPCDANEAQTIKSQYPHIECLGFEPSQKMLERQWELDFPGDLYPYALSDEDGTAMFYTSNSEGGQRTGSIARPGMTENGVEVVTRTLDSLSEELGPFENVVLWIDIEHAELPCLKGAKHLLESEQILMIDLEIMQPEQLVPIKEFLDPYGLREVKRWNAMIKGMNDIVFKKDNT